MTSLLQALIRQCWSPYAMGANQGEQVGEQFGLRSNEAWALLPTTQSPPIPWTPLPPFLFSRIGCVYNTTRSREQTQNVEGMWISPLIFFSASLLMQGSLSNTVPVSTVVRSCTACIWLSVKLHRLFPFPTATVKSRLLFVAKPLLKKSNATWC